MTKYEILRMIFEENKDEERALPMAHYMRDQFVFYGISSTKRKELCLDFMKAQRKEEETDWNFITDCYNDPHRECQYQACDYLLARAKYLAKKDLPRIRKLVMTKSWWDTVDVLNKVCGQIFLKDNTISDTMTAWSLDENMWVRRCAIEFQLLLKDKTDTHVLAEILENNLGSDESFINKAIGWALRDYSKTNPAWVSAFIETHQEKMNNLSIREGSKYLKDQKRT